MADRPTHVFGDIFRVGKTGSSPSVRVAVIDRPKVAVVGERREVCCGRGHVTVEGAGLEFGGNVQRGFDGAHEGSRDRPVVPEVERPALRVERGGPWMVSFKEGSEGREELVKGLGGVCSVLGKQPG